MNKARESSQSLNDFQITPKNYIFNLSVTPNTIIMTLKISKISKNKLFFT